MIPRICASFSPETVAEALKLIDKAKEAKINFVEIRLDNLDSYEKLADLAKYTEIPKIATNRLVSQRGQFKGTETEQKHILLTAAKYGFEYVDIDLSSSNLKEFIIEASEYGAKLIVSFHDFDGAFKLAELDSILEREITCGADVCKIVTMAKRVEDNLELLNFTYAACKRANIICFAMGDAGKVSRLLSPLFGGYLTFAALEHGKETAVGQMTVQEMKSSYNLLGI